MAYFNTPQANQNLSVSQPQIQSNFLQQNTSFSVDHYGFDAVTSNGFHKHVTTPNQASIPSASVNPEFFGYTVGNIPVIQYSLGFDQAVITPVTNLQSGISAIVLAALGTTNVLDFTGITRASCELYILSDTVGQSVVYPIFWNGSTFSIITPVDVTNLRPQASGNVIQIKNFSASLSFNVYWTLKMLRVT